MTSRGGASVDPLAAASAVLTAAMTGVCVVVIHRQGDSPLIWVLVMLVAAAVLTGDGAARHAPHRRLALVVAGIALTLLGLLAILSIGLPIVAAGIAPEDASGAPHGRNRPVELAKRLAIPA